MANIMTRSLSRPPPSLKWEYNSRYGIVHPCDGCGVCSLYIQHMSHALFDEDPSFQCARNALKEREESIKSDGVAEGRQLERLCSQVPSEELTQLRARNEMLQAECDRMRLVLTDVGGLHKSRNTSHSEPEPLARPTSPAESFSSENSFATPSTGPETLPRCPSPPSPGGGPLTYSAAVLGSSNDSSALLLRSQNPVSLSLSRPSTTDTSTMSSQSCSSSIPGVSTGPSSPPSSWQTASPVRIRTPVTMSQLYALLKQANKPGNIEHYKKVKEMCTEAHAARDHKTELQKTLLMKWKTPEWARGHNRPAEAGVTHVAPLNPLRDDPPEQWIAYLAVHPASWPLGVRKDALGKALLADMKASRIAARLAPEMVVNEPTTRMACRQFKEVVVRLFAQHRAYLECLTKNGISISDEVRHQPFVGSTEAMTPDNIARHFAACGISFAVGENEIGPWARQCIREWDKKKAMVGALP